MIKSAYGKTAKYIITDLGQELCATKEGEPNASIVIPRYGVWEVRGDVAKEVVKTGNSLPELMGEYNVTLENVFQLKPGLQKLGEPKPSVTWQCACSRDDCRGSSLTEGGLCQNCINSGCKAFARIGAK